MLFMTGSLTSNAGSRWLPVLTLTLLLSSQSVLARSTAKQTKAPLPDSLSTVVVNGVPLTETALNREINRLAPVADYHSLSKRRWQAIREQAIDRLVDKELFYQEAIRRGIGWDEQWVEFIYEKNKKELASSGRDSRILEDAQVKNRLLNDLRQTYVISKLWQQGKAQTVPTEQEIKSWFENHRANYKTPLSVKVEELTLSMQPSATKSQWDAAKMRIQQIYRQSKRRGGFTVYQKDPAIKLTKKTIHLGMQSYDVKTIASMADNDISKPVFSLYGYRLIRKIETLPQVKYNLAEVEQQVRADVHNHKYTIWLTQLKQSLRDKSEIIIGAGSGYVGR